MTWFKVDDSFDFHPKAIAAGNAALGLWVRAGAYASRQLTEGFVPREMLAALGGRPKEATALVAAGLWVAVEGGYRFHQWEERNPRRESVLADREAAAARQRRARERAAKARRDRDAGDDVTPDVTRDNGRDVTPYVTPDVTRESRSPRPDPTRPVSSYGGSDPSSSDLPEREPTRPDDDRGPTTQQLLNLGTGRLKPAELAAEAEAFKAHNAGRWGDLRDIRRAWSGWLSTAQQRRRPTPTPGRPECPVHPGQPTGSVDCPQCAAEHVPAPSLRELRAQTSEAS